MEINLYAILACVIVAMALGFVWYGPLFGKKWMEIIGATVLDELRRKEMQKAAMPLYVITAVLTFVQAYVLAHYLKVWQEVSGVENALWIFAAFILPTIAAGAMWNNDSTKVKWARFLIQAGYYLVLFVIFGYILSRWG